MTEGPFPHPLNERVPGPLPRALLYVPALAGLLIVGALWLRHFRAEKRRERGDVARAAEILRDVWGRGWVVTEVTATVGDAEWPIAAGRIVGSDGLERAFRAYFRPADGWRIHLLQTSGGVLLPLPREVEAPEAVPILDLSIAILEESPTAWKLEATATVVGPGLGLEGRWIRRSVMLRARCRGPRGTVHEGGGISTTWWMEPSASGARVLTHPIAILKEWGPGPWRITLVAEDRSGRTTTRDADITLE
jgi:hypothetical protein